MNTLLFKATGDKYNSYRALFNGKDIDSCDIDSKQVVTQAHVIIKSVINSLQKKYPKGRYDNKWDFDIIFDDSKAIHPRTRFGSTNLVSMSQYADHTGLTRTYEL